MSVYASTPKAQPETLDAAVARLSLLLVVVWLGQCKKNNKHLATAQAILAFMLRLYSLLILDCQGGSFGVVAFMRHISVHSTSPDGKGLGRMDSPAFRLKSGWWLFLGVLFEL